MTGSEASPSFRLAYVPGVTPAKWVRIWRERQPDVPLELAQSANAETPDLLRRAEADAGLLRLPCDRDGLSAIPLYTETTVVVVPKDHLVAAVEEVSLADLADEVLFHPLDDVFDWERPPGRPAIERPATTADAIELVAAGVGLLVVPQSLARLHHRRDLTYRPVVDAPQSRVALSWPEERTTDLVEDFIGIVRGRTVNSSRGRRPEPASGRRDGAPSGGKGQDTPRGGRGASAAGGSRGAKASGGAKSSGRSSGGAKGSGRGTGGGRRGTTGRSGGGGRGKSKGRG